MGNKNARTKKSFDLPDLTLPSSFTTNKTAEANGSAVASPKSPLAFKSFRQGTLITPNFEAMGKTAVKSLSATSPEFVPALPLIAPFPKVTADSSREGPAVEKLQTQQEVVHDAEMTATPRHIYNEVEELEDTSNLPKEMEVGVIPANRIQPNSAGGHSLNRMVAVRPLQDEMNALSISSANSTPEKAGPSNFVTPIKTKGTPLSTPSTVPTGPRPEKPRYGRADKKKKDVIITQTGVIRNLACITDRFTENGIPYKHTCADEFRPDVYDLANFVRNLPIEERKEFWAKNWIEIEVDLRSEEEFGINSQVNGQEQRPRDYDTLLHYIDYLGPDFAAYAKYIFISILFPSISDADQSKVNSSVLHCQQTLEFQHLEKLVAKLQRFPKIKRLDIILQTPSNTKKPLSIPQLNLVLPFYDLGFTDWNIKWKTSFMTKAEPVGGWPIHYLDKERNRLLRERERVKNAVFVRKSQFVD